MTPSDSLDPHERPTLERPGTFALTVGAVGVVYGDIGTSPLYAFREALRPAAANGITEAEVLGVASLLIWALILIVTLKYVIFLMRADNGGEGGVLSLYALVRDTSRQAGGLFVLGIVGASLFFGDAIITPAISVLSAVEGVKLVTPVLEPWILPITFAIITALFLVQSRGTGPLARWFGPITVLWFVAMALAGLAEVIAMPAVAFALNPLMALTFLAENGLVGVVVLGAVLVLIMWTWNRGTRQLVDQTRPGAVPLRDFVHRVSTSPPVRVPGAAVFFTSDGEAVPQALLQNLRYNQVLHERIIILTIETPAVPYVPAAERARIEHLSEQVVSVRLRFGFMETPNVNRTLGELRGQGLRIAGMKTLFFLGRRKLVPRADIGMPGWQDRLYILLSSLAADPSDFYRLPRDRVVEIGAQIAV